MLNSLTKTDTEYFENFWPSIAEAWNNGNREPYKKGHENSIFMVPNSQTLSNPTDIRLFVDGFPECTLEFSDFNIMGNQGLLAVRGNYLINDMDGGLMDKGKYVTLFEKTGSGEWDMTHGIWNSDLAVAVPE